MPDVLNQSDLETLLSAVDDGEVQEERGVAQIFSRHRRDFEQIDIRPYDFKRPERISKGQIRAIQTLHESFARSLGGSLSGFMRTIVEVGVAQVEQLTYAEFTDGLPNPTSFNLIQVPPLEGRMCLEVSPLIVYPLIDRLLGGSTCDLSVPSRPMTLIETRLIQRVLKRAMSALREAWEGVADIDFTLGDMESNPQLVQIVPPNEVVIAVRFELKMGKRAGTMSLCIPYNVIEPIAHSLDAQSWCSNRRRVSSPQWQQRVTARLHEAPLRLAAILAETTITIEDLRNLEVGDIIVTEKPAASAIHVCIEGIPKYEAKIGQIKGNRAVQIAGRVDAQQSHTADEPALVREAPDPAT